MTTTEHLQLIKAECERLLAIAEKRTQGEWRSTTPRSLRGHLVSGEHGKQVADVHYEGDGVAGYNATYIAACAGRAEAGWRATLDCVNHFLWVASIDLETDIDLLSVVLTAWPTELLKP
jgi:hypothetical protein